MKSSSTNTLEREAWAVADQQQLAQDDATETNILMRSHLTEVPMNENL